MTLGYIAAILFLLMDPIGNISSMIKLLNDVPPEKRKFVIVREMLFALLTIVIFYFLGEGIFSILKISETTLVLTLGIILFLVAIKILFPSVDSLRANLPSGEPFVSPLAIPLIAGPAVLATVMLFAHFEESHVKVLSAIVIAWVAALLVLLSGHRLESILKSAGLSAAERLMGLVLVMLAVQKILEGLHTFVKTCQ